MTNCAALTPKMINAQRHWDPREQRILLRYWGVTHQARALLQDLPSFDGRVVWSEDGSQLTAPDLVVHLIDPSYLQTVSAATLAAGELEPASAMRRAFRHGNKEVALILGSPTLLAQKRYGCWISAGRRTAMEALSIIARTLVEPALDPESKQRFNLHDLAESNMLCVLSNESATEPEVLAQKVILALGTVLGLSLQAPARIVVGAPECIIASVVRSYPIDRAQIHFVRQTEAMNDLSVDLLIAYPWSAARLK